MALVTGAPVALLLSLAGCWWGPKQIDRERVYRIGYGSDVPFHFKGKDGVPAGLAVELVAESARRKGIKLNWVEGSDVTKVDLVVLKTITPARRKTQHFSEPYLETDTWFVVPENSSTRGIENLRTARISFTDVAIHRENLSRLLPGFQPVSTKSTVEALEKVRGGQADAAYLDEYTLMPALLSGGNSPPLRTLPTGDQKGSMALSASLPCAAVADEIRDGMRDLAAEGAIATIVGKAGVFPNLTADLVHELVIANRRSQRLFASSVGLAVVTLIVVWLALRSRQQSLKLVRTERALKDSESKYRLAMNAVSDALWDWDVSTGKVYYSPAWANLLRDSEVPPVFDSWKQRVHPDDLPTVEQSLQDHLEGRSEVWNCEHRLMTRPEGWKWVLGRGQVQDRDPTGRPRRMVGTIADITARKAAEASLQHANHELEQRVAKRTSELASRVVEVEQLNQDLEAFSYSVSHDLRTPLRNITGFLELLSQRLTGRLNPEEARYISTVERESTRMGTLITDLLTFSKVGRTELRLERVPLAELVAEVRGELQPLTGDRLIEWQVPELPVVRGDRALLRQVVANLLANAVKFSRHREPAVIEIGQIRDGAADQTVTIFVRDNGAGFNPKYSEKLFGVFQRLHTTRDFEGTGIGLANVKRIVERHGGRVWARGEVDQGATFFFNLPVADGPSP